MNESDPFRGIGNRMLLQLLPGKELRSIIDSYKAPDPWTVLQLVAKYKKQKLEDATIMVIIDGMQNIMSSYEDGFNANSLAHNKAFLLPCCTAMASRLVDQSLRRFNRKCVYLPVASLKPPNIYQNGITESAFQMHDTTLQIFLAISESSAIYIQMQSHIESRAIRMQSEICISSWQSQLCKSSLCTI
ncbi:hypothetical protein BC937DRAFT_90341 [Endogone sp. FLAS-F59071]|nr:hypothetical protein BC937DRAFT_90341 [Endogone sp. FLAS-F59071]|eukprot:RUS23222.1 hypothetical protein BC937DRAFT_90341 [Endogone sp. FLAS-F59071]